MNGFIKIIKSLEDFSVLIYGVTETVKNKTKKKKVDFFCIKRHKWSKVGVRRAGTRYMDKIF